MGSRTPSPSALLDGLANEYISQLRCNTEQSTPVKDKHDETNAAATC